MDKNGLSNATWPFMGIALAKANVVAESVDHFSRVDASFADPFGQASFLVRGIQERRSGWG